MGVPEPVRQGRREPGPGRRGLEPPPGGRVVDRAIVHRVDAKGPPRGKARGSPATCSCVTCRKRTLFLLHRDRGGTDPQGPGPPLVRMLRDRSLQCPSEAFTTATACRVGARRRVRRRTTPSGDEHPRGGRVFSSGAVWLAAFRVCGMPVEQLQSIELSQPLINSPIFAAAEIEATSGASFASVVSQKW